MGGQANLFGSGGSRSLLPLEETLKPKGFLMFSGESKGNMGKKMVKDK